MIKQYEYLKDSTFLKQLDNTKTKTIYTNITILNWNEDPIQNIEGKVNSGSITIDGKSSMRRTLSLNLLADQTNNQIKNVNNLLSINKKIFVQIGIKNTLNKYTDYDIIWFPIGIFVIFTVSINHSTNNYIISLQAKDKMCLLNGQCGGTFPASVVLDSYDTIDQNGEAVVLRPSIYQIIRQVVNHFGKEDLSKIIISDLDTRVKQVVKWTGSTPLYFLARSSEEQGVNYKMTIDGKQYKSLLNQGWKNILGSPFEYGRDIGFIYTDFTYPGELIVQPGQPITKALDSIISVLGNYEYFYDVFGNFIFQEIKNYLNNSQTKYIEDELGRDIPVADYISDLREYGSVLSNDYLINNNLGKSVYSFDGGVLVDSYTNNPQFNNIKNDYIVWGIKKGNSNVQKPIRYHLAIDKKPKTGNEYQVFPYNDPEDGSLKFHVPIKFNSFNNFPTKGAAGVFYLANDTGKVYEWGNVNGVYKYAQINTRVITVRTKDWRTELYLQGLAAEPFGTAANDYFSELVNEWPKLYKFVYKGSYYEDQLREEIAASPEDADYFLDFIDSTSKVGQFEITNIGKRTAVMNEGDKVNCVFEPQIPDIILIPTEGVETPGSVVAEMRDQAIRRNQAYYQTQGNIYNNIQPGGSYNSAYQVIRQMLHTYTGYNENITLSCIPIYYLEPNTRITVRDQESGISGDYMINSISYNLDSNSMMSLSCTKALDKI